ncbi:hypothetical protein VDG41_19715 [Xanthomonas campestris pv. raphani]|nr:hypothetical protein [Xanthomonas campestris pv. raphani]
MEEKPLENTEKTACRSGARRQCTRIAPARDSFATATVINVS